MNVHTDPDCGLPWLALAALWTAVAVTTVVVLEVGSRLVERWRPTLR